MVIAEPALRWTIGGATVLREQLEHLVEMAGRPNVEFQVLPLAAGAHLGTEGAFTVLSAPPELHNYPGCVFVEDRVRGHFYEEPDQLMAYRNDLSRLRVQALKPEESLGFLRQLVKDSDDHEARGGGRRSR